MTLAIHLSLKDDIHEFVLNTFRHAASLNPSDHFIFIFDGAIPHALALPENCTPFQTGPEIKNSLVRHYWYNFKIPAILNRYQADVLFTPREICSLNTEVPQIMLLSAVSPRTGGYREQYRKKYVSKAFAIGVFEKDVYARAMKIYASQKHKIKYTGHGILNLKKTGKHLSESPGTISTGEDPYFVTTLNRHNEKEAVMLLKAFSIFKKWQRSSYKLVIVNHGSGIESIVPNFSSYKYKEEVIVLNKPSGQELLSTLCDAFACIQLFHPANGIRTEIGAMSAGIPVISNCPEDDREHFLGSSALYAPPSENGIAEQMMRLYKDETLYKELSAKSIETADEFSWQKTAETLYDMAMKAMGQTS